MRTAHFVSSHPLVASVDQTGLITVRGDGTAKITVDVDGVSASVPVTVKEFKAGVPVHFGNQVVPIFTKLGCNAGGCHGKSSGQNGFRLSLLGFEPALDYETLVKEAAAAGGCSPRHRMPACCSRRQPPEHPTAAGADLIPTHTNIN